MIQLIARFKAFHSAISKMIIGIREANSPYSFDEISLSTTPLMGNEFRSDRKQEIQVQLLENIQE